MLTEQQIFAKIDELNAQFQSDLNTLSALPETKPFFAGIDLSDNNDDYDEQVYNSLNENTDAVKIPILKQVFDFLTELKPINSFQKEFEDAVKKLESAENANNDADITDAKIKINDLAIKVEPILNHFVVLVGDLKTKVKEYAEAEANKQLKHAKNALKAAKEQQTNLAAFNVPSNVEVKEATVKLKAAQELNSAIAKAVSELDFKVDGNPALDMARTRAKQTKSRQEQAVKSAEDLVVKSGNFTTTKDAALEQANSAFVCAEKFLALATELVDAIKNDQKVTFDISTIATEWNDKKAEFRTQSDLVEQAKNAVETAGVELDRANALAETFKVLNDVKPQQELARETARIKSQSDSKVHATNNLKSAFG